MRERQISQKNIKWLIDSEGDTRCLLLPSASKLQTAAMRKQCENDKLEVDQYKRKQP